MGVQTERWVCPKCGANNFEAVQACWKCNTTRIVAPMPFASVAPPPSPSLPERPSPFTTPMYAPAAVSDGDPGLARRAALLLALTLPWLGVPVGWIFMMMEDRKRQAIGRFCVMWSCVSLLLHFVLMIFATQMITSNLLRVLEPIMQNMNKNQKVPSLPDMNRDSFGGQ